MVKVAEQLWQEPSRRCRIATVAHRWVHQHHSLTMSCRYRLWLYQQIWRLRTRIDQRLLERHPQASTGKPFRHDDVTLDQIRRWKPRAPERGPDDTEAELKQIHGNVAWVEAFHLMGRPQHRLGLLKEAARTIRKRST